MGLTVPLLFAVLIILSLYCYLKVLYDSLKRIKILNNNSDFSNLRKTSDKLIKNTEITSEIIVLPQAPGPLPWPILGNLALLGQYDVPFEGFTDLSKRFGDIYSLTLGTTRCLIVNNLNSIKEVLNQNGKFFGGRPDFIRYQKLFGGDRSNSLALCDWSQLQQKRRNLARKHCSPRDTSSYFAKMNDVGCFEMQEFMRKLSNSLQQNNEFHLKPLIMQTCANMFCQYMSSIRFDYEDKEFQTVVRYFDEIFWEINQGYAIDFLPWLLPFYKKHMDTIVNWSTTIRNFILNRIIINREKTVNIDEPEKDFTDALLRSLSEDSDVSRNTIIYMLEDFIGGHSAIGNLVMLSLASVVKNPSIGKKIQNEIYEITGGERPVTLMDVDKMPFTVATIYEVLRDSSSPIVPHVATEDVSVGGYGVSKGTLVIINNYLLNKSEEYWDQPNEFNPERFIESVQIPFPTTKSNQIEEKFIKENEVNKKKIDKNNYENEYQKKYMEVRRLKKNIPHFLPFSIGKRTCIGQNLVKGFGFIMLANIMQSYNISCRDINKIKTYPACVALPPDTFSLQLTQRI
ncbi:cytochrome P450 307a1-like [Condylostylus longicornis]|uniref:cytochrome P450 307a1-like n=1 Tax=Condylostylus longicornis TaxID=2530218 RepID=UPI00244E5372|nr:cytochrome P450 307a1-like [Condylostylus longicornis]